MQLPEITLTIPPFWCKNGDREIVPSDPGRWRFIVILVVGQRRRVGLEGHDHDVGLKMCQCSVYSILYSNILYIYIYCIILNYVSAILCVYIFLLYSIDFNKQ